VDEGKEELLVGPYPQVHASAPHQVLGTVSLLELKVVPGKDKERVEGLKISYRRSRLSNPGLDKLLVLPVVFYLLLQEVEGLSGHGLAHILNLELFLPTKTLE
jgi:hypothetical protein